MLHVAALLVAGSAALDDDGALSATRIPTTCYEIDEVPLSAEVPVVLVVHARAGGDYDPQLYIVCKDPAGVKRGGIEAAWHWPDDDGKPSKYRCFTQKIPFDIVSEGEYTIGAYFDAEGMIEIYTPIPVSILLTTVKAAATNGGDSAEESLQFGGI
ncbi:MAG: hypothetical protein WBR28_22495 [Mycobacterium sp.]